MSAPALYIVVCGAPLAARIGDGVREARARGWIPVVVPTEASRRWVDEVDLNGARIRAGASSEDDVPPAAAIAVVPATFNTLNAWANGRADTFALTTLCAALGARCPTVAVPFAKHDLAGHPAWLASLAVLRHGGVTIVDAHTGALAQAEPIQSTTGESIARAFRWEWALDPLERHESASPGRDFSSSDEG
ncbi:flavoprotein [Angustibacter sp. McL0619]|uniref:flavoprotein n=1 Tax=Angustibacter sp. McL0619 TaxID=3415676 RepID=UPI003CF209D8